MKTIRAFPAPAFMLLFSCSAGLSQNIWLGFSAGEQIPRFKASAAPSLDSLAFESRQNFYLSFPLEVEFTKHFSFQAEFGYGRKKISWVYPDFSSFKDWKNEDIYEYLDFMILPRFQYAVGRVQLSLFGGPGLAWVNSGRYQYQLTEFSQTFMYAGSLEFNSYSYNRAHWTANVGASLAYKLKIGKIFLDARFQQDLTDKNNRSFLYYYDHSFQYMAGFSFHLKRKKK